MPVGKIAAALNLKVQSDALDANISGLIRKISDAPAQFAITVNVADAPVRQRFTVAHEIAHYLFDPKWICIDEGETGREV